MLNKVIYQNQEKVRKDVGALLVEAFPEDERPPVDVFFNNLNKDSNELMAFYEEDKFIGFASTIIYQDICYIFFLAVSSSYRRQGYGGQILELLKKEYQDYILLLAFEEVNPQYSNYEERVKRQKFYLKHGFIDNDLITDEWGVRFQTAYIGQRKVSFEEYQEIFKLGFGDWTIEYLKRG